MSDHPTIIAAHLSDDELKNSIKQLVDIVQNQTNAMAASFDSAVNRMTDALARLSQAQQESTNKSKKATSERVASYDNEAAAIERSARAKAKNRGIEYIEFRSDADKSLTYYVNVNKDVEAQMSAILQKEQEIIAAKEREAEITRQIESARASSPTGISGDSLGWGSNLDMTNRSRNIYKNEAQDVTYLRQQIAGLLDIDDKEVKVANVKTATYGRLSDYLNQLRAAYHNLGSDIRKGEGKDIADEYQRIARAKQKFDAELSRPTSLNAALRLPAETLDDIAYKMRQLQSYKQGLNLSNPKDVAEIKQVNGELDKLDQSLRRYQSDAQRATGVNKVLSRSWNYMKNRLAFYLTVETARRFAKSLIEVRGQYELLERSIGILVDSAQKGHQIFSELNAMAIKSPFTAMELGAAAKQLVAFNIGAEDVVDTTRRLADMAAAVGIPMDRLTYALGQVRAYGYLNSRDARIFLNAGIPIITMLQEMYNKQRDVNEEMLSAADVRELMTKKLVSFSDVMKVINEATDEGGRFFNFQEKAADTLKIRIANLNLAYNNMLNDIGKSTQGVLNGTMKGLTFLLKNWREVARVLGTATLAWFTYRTAMKLANKELRVASIGAAIEALKKYIKGIRSATTAQQAFNAAVKSNVFVALATALVSVISYFVIFNSRARETKRRIDELGDAFEETARGFRKIFTEGFESSSFSDQRKALQQMIDKAKEDLNLSIPIKIEDLSEEEIKDKLVTTQKTINSYLSSSRLIANSAIETTGFEKAIERYENSVADLRDFVSENVDAIKERLNLYTYLPREKIELFNRAEGEKDVEYLDRVIKLMKDLGLVTLNNKNQLLVTSWAEGAFDDETEKRFTKIVKAIEAYNLASVNAGKYTAQFLNKANEKLPLAQESAEKLSYAFEEIGKNMSFGSYGIDMMKDIAAEKFEIPFAPSDDTKKKSEKELKDWQQKLQDWADKNGIKIPTELKFDSEAVAAMSEVEYADAATKAAKEAQEAVKVQERKLAAGTGSQEALKRAMELEKNAKALARQAGGDLSSLNKGGKKDPFGDALSKQVQLIGEVQKRFKEYKKMGVETQDALAKSSEEFNNSIEKNNAELKKFGVNTLSATQLATMPMQLIRDFYKEQLNVASLKNNAKGIEALEKAIANLNVEITKVDYKKITDGLNSELEKLKSEYELSVELDANPEFADGISDFFMDAFDVDVSTFPKTIEEYSTKILEEMNRAFASEKKGFRLDTLLLTDDDLRAFKEESLKEAGAINEDEYNMIEKHVKNIRSLRDKDFRETQKRARELQYKLSDVNGKIDMEREKLAKLEEKRDKETNEQKRALLDLEVKEQEEVIAKLQEEVLQLLPTYQKLFNGVAEHSALVTRRIALQWKAALAAAVVDENGNYTITDPETGAKATITKKQYGTETSKVNKELLKTQSTIKKIREAFTKGSDDEVDFMQGLEYISEEASKAADGLQTVSEIMEAFGASKSAVETVSDLGNTLSGIASMGQGIAQMAVDPIGGMMTVIKGAWQAISTWMDNRNNRISEAIEDSTRRVARLEAEYEKLEARIEKALGEEEIYARRLAIQNKEAQLAQMEYQLALERRREYKKESDKQEQQDNILDYIKDIDALKREIQCAKDDIVNNLLGEDVKSAAESFVDSWVEAWREGETTLDAVQEKMDEMIYNMIKKGVTSRLIQQPLKNLYDEIDSMTNRGSAGDYGITEEEMEQIVRLSEATGVEINDILGRYYGMLESLGIISKEVGKSELSKLQQGIQGITEDTAGALEAYMNGVSQQVYLHSTLLTQIRDAVLNIESGAGVGVQSQMLFQLQQSYAVQMSIQNMLSGWSSPDGLSVRVDML